jgi:hypothetical protein
MTDDSNDRIAVMNEHRYDGVAVKLFTCRIEPVARERRGMLCQAPHELRCPGAPLSSASARAFRQ